MSIKLNLPKLVDIKPRLTVVGVGGAGCNAVNNMIAAGLQGVEFVVANTDAQSLAASSAENRIQLGANLTEGLGAGSRPEIGEAAAEEALDEIRSLVAGSHMVFIAAGMGGGTGTGAASVIARQARELGALTVGIVCKPFQFEGARRMRIAEAGVQSLRQHVDTLIVIPNQNLFRVANERTTFAEAFVLADQVLYSGVACIVDLVLKEGLINLDFADVKTVMSGMGTAMMGTGEASGDRRATLAAEEAIANPLLDDVTLKGARGLLLSITGGRDLTLYEVDEAASRVRQEVDPDANIIVGATFDDNLGDRVRVSIVASGMGRQGELAQPQMTAQQKTQPAATAKPASSHFPFVPHPNQMPAPAPQFAPQTHVNYVPPLQSQPAPQAAHVQNGAEDDIQRRLSEVISHVNGAPQAMHQPQPGQSPASHQPASYHDEQRNSWTSPGNVRIDEGYAPFQASGLGQQTQARAPSDTSGWAQPQPQGYDQSQGFVAAPPAELPRNARRMPAVEDFPAVGQREWHAKQAPVPAHTPAPAHQPPTDERRRGGLLSRITGLGKKSAETAPIRNSDTTQTGEGEAPLPVFFGRERR